MPDRTCPGCDYDLSGVEGVCPECGASFTDESLAMYWSRERADSSQLLRGIRACALWPWTLPISGLALIPMTRGWPETESVASAVGALVLLSQGACACVALIAVPAVVLSRRIAPRQTFMSIGWMLISWLSAALACLFVLVVVSL